MIEASKNRPSNYTLATGAVCVVGVYFIWVQTSKPPQEQHPIVRRIRAGEYIRRNGDILRNVIMEERPLGNSHQDEDDIWRALPEPRPFEQGVA